MFYHLANKLTYVQLFEKQKECRDTVRSLVCEMSDLLSNGLEKYSGALGAHSNTKKAFKSVAEAVNELLHVAIEQQNKGAAGTLRKFHATILFHKPNDVPS